MVDLTMDQTASDLFVDALLPTFDAVSNNSDEECRRLQAELQNVQCWLDHLCTYSSQQEGRLASEKTKRLEAMASTKESHLNEVRALHKRVGARASDLSAAQAEVQRLQSVQRAPLGLTLPLTLF